MGCGATTAHSHGCAQPGAPLKWKDGATVKVPVGNALGWIRWRRRSSKVQNSRGEDVLIESFSVIPAADKAVQDPSLGTRAPRSSSKKKSRDSRSKQVLTIDSEANTKRPDEEDEMTTRSGSDTSSRQSMSPVVSRAEQMPSTEIEESPQRDLSPDLSALDPAQKCGACEEEGTATQCNHSLEGEMSQSEKKPVLSLSKPGSSPSETVAAVEDVPPNEGAVLQSACRLDSEECSSVKSMSCESRSPFPTAHLPSAAPDASSSSNPDERVSMEHVDDCVDPPSDTRIDGAGVAAPASVEISSPDSSASMLSMSVEPVIVAAAEVPPPDHPEFPLGQTTKSDSSASMISMECESPSCKKDADEELTSVEDCTTPASTSNQAESGADPCSIASQHADETVAANHDIQKEADEPTKQLDHTEAKAEPSPEVNNIALEHADVHQTAEVRSVSLAAGSESEDPAVHISSSSSVSGANDALPQCELEEKTDAAANAIEGQAAVQAHGNDSLGEDLIAAVMGSPETPERGPEARPVIGLAGICNKANVEIPKRLSLNIAREDVDEDANFQNVWKVPEVDIDEDLMSSDYSGSGKWTVFDDSGDWDDAEGLELPGVGLTRQALEQRLEVARAQSRLGQADSGSPCESPSGSSSGSPPASPDGNGPSLTPGSEIDWSALYNLSTEEDDDAEMLGYVVKGGFFGLETIYEEYGSDCEENYEDDDEDNIKEDVKEEEPEKEEEVPLKLPARPTDEVDQDFDAAENRSCPSESDVDEPVDEDENDQSDAPEEDVPEEDSDEEKQPEEKHYMRDSLKMVDFSQMLPCGRGTPSFFQRYSLSSLHEDKKQVARLDEEIGSDDLLSLLPEAPIEGPGSDDSS